MSDAPEPDRNSISVADRVLVQFVDALAENEALGEVAGRMKAALISDRPVTEAALRQALFGEDDA